MGILCVAAPGPLPWPLLLGEAPGLGASIPAHRSILLLCNTSRPCKPVCEALSFPGNCPFPAAFFPLSLGTPGAHQQFLACECAAITTPSNSQPCWKDAPPCLSRMLLSLHPVCPDSPIRAPPPAPRNVA